MKKTTLKNALIVLLFAFALHGYAQDPITAIAEGTKYNLQNFATGNFLKATDDTGDGSYEFAAAVDNMNITFNFAFDHYDDGTLSFPDDWNIGNDTRGIMRAANPGTVHTNFAFDNPNPNGGQKTDKRWTETTLEQSGLTTFRLSPLTDNANGSNSNPERYLYQGLDGVLYNYTIEAMNDAANTNTDGEARSFWVIRTSAVLSNEQFDTSAIFVSNPVSNEVRITGLTPDVKQVSVYSLVGKEVISRTVNAESEVSLDASSLASGMYLVDIKGDNGSYTQKIIKQ